MLRYLTLPVLFFLITQISRSATVDTVSVYSYSMHKYILCAVVKPKAYKKKKNRFPAVYVLHGYDGSFSNWLTRVPELMEYADKYQCIIITPDGAKNSWYFDSPINASFRYETFIALEVTHFIDSAYRTIADREHRAITGLSMGGHGALYLSFRHPDIFGASGSMSGGVDLMESRNRFEIEKLLGTSTDNPDNWKNYSLLNVEIKPALPLKILLDCGESDIFIEGNRKFHAKLVSLKIPHEYIERPGGHSWAYWKNAVEYHLLFFKKFFIVNKTG